MKRGFLSEHFSDFAFKRLSPVEAETSRSNQHEFNGVSTLRDMLGDTDKIEVPTSFIYLCDEDEPSYDQAFLSWYDARRSHPNRTEWRLYFPTTTVSERASSGDLLIIAQRPDQTLAVIVADGGSTTESQLLWLFGALDDHLPGFSVVGESVTDRIRLEFAARTILEQIGVEIDAFDDGLLDGVLARFGKAFPTTREFSRFARSTLPDLGNVSDPDAALMALLEREEVLFRLLEKHLIAGRLAKGFDEVDEFLKFSLSVQNRRKSRAGHALENHLEYLFDSAGILCDRTPVTEGKSKPDFLFPGSDAYHDTGFPTDMLTVLGVKSSCKDRWRQILSEADRLERKHLLTLEPSISEAQTTEMRERKVQLVLPKELHRTYSSNQQEWLFSLGDMFRLILERQSLSGQPRRLI